MKDYGLREPWTKLVYMLDLLPAEIRFYHDIAYSNDGSEVLVHDPCHSLLWFDLKKEEVEAFFGQWNGEFGRNRDVVGKHCWRRCKVIQHKEMSELPLEVLADILSRLPQKSIVRFRPVSTSWLSLIDSYEFFKLRLNGSVRTRTNVSLMLRDPDCLHMIDFSSHENVSMTVKVMSDLLGQDKCKIQIYGSSNGLICLSDQSKHLLFWNLRTGVSQKIPPTLSELHPHDDKEVFGFGYDTINDDYKVVKIVLTVSIHYFYPRNEVKVYSSKSNSWHKVECVPNGRYIRPKDGILVSGALHWAIDENRHSSKLRHIVAFDLSSEEYSLVPPPECSDTDCPRLQSFGGFLAVICNDSRRSFHIWVMKDYGVKESWTKLVFRGDIFLYGFRYCCAIAYSKDGSHVLVHDPYHYLLWFDLKKKKFKPFLVEGMESFCKFDTWLGSADPGN